MYKISCFLFILFLLPVLSSAQSDFPGEVPTPQAADLGRYGDVPVSLYTGTMSLSIPIHSVTVRGVTLDASNLLQDAVSWSLGVSTKKIEKIISNLEIGDKLSKDIIKLFLNIESDLLDKSMEKYMDLSDEQ